MDARALPAILPAPEYHQEHHQGEEPSHVGQVCRLRLETKTLRGLRWPPPNVEAPVAARLEASAA